MMKSNGRSQWVVLAGASALMLAACGGGGGGGDSASAGPSAPSTQLAVTSSNSQAVAAQVLTTSEQGTQAATLANQLALGAQVDGGAQVPGPVVLQAVATRFLQVAPVGTDLAVGATTTQTEACSGGGSATVQMTRARSGSMLVAGDGVAVSASNCIETIGGSSMRLNGGLSVNVAAGGFDPTSVAYPKDATLSLAATGFTMVSGTQSAALDGSLSLRVTQSSSSAGSLTLTTPALTWRLSTTGGSYQMSLANYRHQLDVTSSSTTQQLTASVTTDSTRLAAGSTSVSYDISTPTPVVTNSTGAFTQGALKVTGKGSALLLTVAGVDTFSVQVDTNGDGSYESSTTATRAQLEALR